MLPSALYRPSLALLTDLYQLTMVQGYHRSGKAMDEAVFHLFFRKPPFGGGYTIAAGLAPAIDWIRSLKFDESDLAYLGGLKAPGGGTLFGADFLKWLAAQPITLDVDAIPEGSVVFPHQPLIRVRGPLWQCQLVETALLTIVNFQTLIATKAARIVLAARGNPVVDFGLRRAQGIDGAISATRAAMIGGVVATSNVLAGKLLGIPVRGTHAHSWVMSFPTELEAFEAYADAMPENTLLLVDTYDTIEGVKNAIKVGKKLQAKGHRLIGVRLDSGDLAYLSQQARAMLDAAGLPGASIVASNDLDEHTIENLKHQHAKIDTWGVGTRLITAHEQPALGGVYKLGAIRSEGGPWRPVIKAGEQSAKSSIPGILGVKRFQSGPTFIGDMIHDELQPSTARAIVDPTDPTRRRTLQGHITELLKPVLRKGAMVGELPTIADAADRRLHELNSLHEAIKRLMNPHEYPVGLEPGLAQRRHDMILAAKPARHTEGAAS